MVGPFILSFTLEAVPDQCHVSLPPGINSRALLWSDVMTRSPVAGLHIHTFTSGHYIHLLFTEHSGPQCHSVLFLTFLEEWEEG